MTSMPSPRKKATSLPWVLSNLYAVGRSSLREMKTIIPAMRPNAMPNTTGPKMSFRISHPNRAPIKKKEKKKMCVCVSSSYNLYTLAPLQAKLYLPYLASLQVISFMPPPLFKLYPPHPCLSSSYVLHTLASLQAISSTPLPLFKLCPPHPCLSSSYVLHILTPLKAMSSTPLPLFKLYPPHPHPS